MTDKRGEAYSRGVILARLGELQRRGYNWVEAREVLEPYAPQGPFSEDLQNLVTQGHVECMDHVQAMCPRSKVRLVL